MWYNLFMETEHLQTIANRIEHDEAFTKKAEEVLLRWQNEPLMAGTYETPQSSHFHAEGKVVRDHLRYILTALFAIVEGKVHLAEIEEFARLKGLNREVQEMEETIKEHGATLEVFALIHDVGKQFCVSIDDNNEIHYHGHEKSVWRKDIQDLLQKMAAVYRLSEHEAERVALLTSHHLFLMHHFNHGHDAKKIEVLNALATKAGEDADDFFDLLQACALLDQVFGSRMQVNEKRTVDYKHLVNSFIAEAEYAPWKREKREQELLEEKRRKINKLFKEVGLDGSSMMRLLHLPGSRDFGILLKSMQAAARGEQEVDAAWSDEAKRRVEEFKKKNL